MVLPTTQKTWGTRGNMLPNVATVGDRDIKGREIKKPLRSSELQINLVAQKHSVN